MNPTDVLSDEIVDLGLAIGLLQKDGGTVEFNSDWFSDPGPIVSKALADEERREALVRFVDTVNGEGDATQVGDITVVKLFDARDLGIADAPDLALNLTLDDSADNYVEVGVSVAFATTGPDTRTELTVPLYRTAKLVGGTLRTVGEHFALAAGAPMRLSTSITFGAQAPDPSGFALAGVLITVGVPVAGGADPTIAIALNGLRLPGSNAPVDIDIGGPDSTVEDALLSLVLGVVRAGASALGSAGDEAMAALDLLGLGPSPDLPPLDIAALTDQGVSAISAWFAEVMSDPTKRHAWLEAVQDLLGGAFDGDELEVPLGSGPATVLIGMTAVPGPGGHLEVTPRVSVRLSTLLGAGPSAVRLSATAAVDVVTVDLADGSLSAVPSAELRVDVSGDTGVALLNTGPVRIGSAQLGVAFRDGALHPLVRMLDVRIDTSDHPVVDLSSADAVVAAAGQVAGDLAEAALNALGPAGAHLNALLGIVPPAGVPPLDVAQLFVDPLQVLRVWWKDLVTVHSATVPEVLAHLRDLISADSIAAHGASVGVPISGTGTKVDPWSVTLVDQVSLDVWLESSTLVVAVTLGFRFDDIAGRCTVIETHARCELIAIDLSGGQASLLRSAELAARLRARGQPEARLSLGPVAIVADSLGLAARWTASDGFDVGLVVPNLAADTGTGRIPLALPVGPDWESAVLADLENLVAVLGASNPAGWLNDLVFLLGWTFGGEPQPRRLSLAALAVNAQVELTRWAKQLLTDEDVLGSIASALARLLTGSTTGLAGEISGRGTPTDPWVLPLSSGPNAVALSLALGPEGPRLSPSQSPSPIQTWRPGVAGIDAAGLAQAVFDEGAFAEDVGALASRRAGLGTGLGNLVARVTNTDVLVAPPQTPPPGVDVHVQPGFTFLRWPEMSIAAALGTAPAPGAVVVRVAIGSATSNPWPAAPADRLVDLTAPGLAPESFTVAAPAAGEWFVSLATRSDATLGTADPTGVLGQAARLGRVITALAAAGPVVVVAVGGAGHAARLAADAQAAVSHLVTLGTPWSAVSFDSARNGSSADALRLLAALLPAVDPGEPDDPDLARGRAIVQGLSNRLLHADLEAPLPEISVRAGLSVRAWFGGLDVAAVERATTAIVAAGLSLRAQARAAVSLASATDARLALRIPIPEVPPPSGHGIVVGGHIELGLAGSGFAAGDVGATPTVRVQLTVADTDTWLIGGPGTFPAGGAAPLEVRFIEARVEVGLGGAASHAELVLHEVSALGAYRDRIVVRPPTTVTGTIEDFPFLPEARAVVAALVNRMRLADAASGAARLVALMDGIGLSVATGLVPDALSHLLHDPVAFFAPQLASVPGRAAILDAVAALVPGAARAGDVVTVGSGPAALTIDLATRRAAVSASGSEGALAWQMELHDLGGPAPNGSVLIGDASFNAGGVRLAFAPFTASLERASATGAAVVVPLWPNPDVDAVASFAAAALPAEAVRLVLTAIRGLDATVRTTVDALAGALGLLSAPDADGSRSIVAPVGLLTDPGGWFTADVFGGGSAGQLEKVTDLFEAIKPFVGLGGTPRGSWPIVDGVALSIGNGATGPTIAVAVDPTAWLGGADRPPFAAGVALGLTLRPSGAPAPSVGLFVGLPEAAPTGSHRRAVHVTLDDTGVRVFLRPTTGADLSLYPDPSGLGALLAAGTVELLLPMVLDALARLSGDPTRLQIGALVSAFGRGLDIVVDPTNPANPATFDGGKLATLAADPVGRLSARAGFLVTQAVAALDPLIAQLPGTPHAVVAGGNLVVTALGITLTVDPSPISVAISGSVSGLDVVDTVAGSFSADASGLTGWSFGVGPAEFELGGPVIRPTLRGGRTGSGGWEVAVGLSLDALAPTDDDHRELFARWRESDGLAVVARTRVGAADVDTTDAEDVALFAADAVLELLGNWVIALDELATMLDTPVNGTQVRELLQGSVLSDADDHKMITSPVSRLPQSLFVLARKLAGALPALPLGPFDLSIHEDGNVVGLRLDITDASQGLDINPGSDVVLTLVTDATWIEPPSGTPPDPGLVVSIVSISNAPIPVVTPQPGIAANGIGLRISKSSGPLLDAGLSIDAAAIYLFGSLQMAGGGDVAVSGGVQVEIAGLAVPLGGGGGDNAVAQGVMKDAGGSGSPPTPKFSPALAVQDHHDGNGVAVSLRAGPGDGPWYLPIRRAFGPVYIEQIGLGTGYTGNPPATPKRLDWISLSLDGNVSLFGITASVDKLRLTYQVSNPFFDAASWSVDLDGFAVAADVSGLTLVGALRRAPLSPPLEGVEYLGMLKIGFNGYGVDLFGGYAHPTGPQGSFASFFAFGALHAPLGGVPAFFITGIGLGLGINRDLAPPTMETITTNPFLVAMKALGPPPEPMAQLETMRTQILPKQGTYWVAAGISFTSFVLISGEIVLTIEFGDGLDITILGLARAELPTPVLKLVSIELGLIARFSTTEGVAMVQAQLTENSWLLMESVRLTGGFAFATWWKGPNAGQFVVTMGGYHPKFSHPGYPVVPRLGLSWNPVSNISVVGESYFALCSEALMAGTSFSVSAKFGPAYARLSFGADGIVFFDPFWFSVSAWAEIAAGIKIWLLFGTVTIEISLGAYIEVTGPPIFVKGHFEICGFEVPFEFGDEGNPEDNALTAAQFRDKYLRASSDAQVIQASLVRGAAASGRKSDGSQQKVPDGSATNPFLVIPEFEMVVITTAPAIDMALKHSGEPDKTLHVDAPDAGVAPMYSHTLTSTFYAEVDKLDVPTLISIADVNIVSRPAAAFPKGVWGEAPNPNAPKVPAGETIDASDGFTISTVLPDPSGAPAINYHQVELPFSGRKPLPFVTNRAKTDARVAAAAQLKAIADGLRPDNALVDERFNIAARLLDAGGYGTVGVAALRGERSAIPTFGSLADDMVTAPAVVSPNVKATKVDRSRPTKPFVAPIVKAVLSGPYTSAAGRSPRTTVAEPGRAVSVAVPSLDGVLAEATGLAPASLVLRPQRAGMADKRALVATGSVPPTRLATAPIAAVVNARPDAASSERLAAMTSGLARGFALHEGELTIVAVASRPTGDESDRLVVRGGSTRVIALAAGGNVLFDNVGGELTTGGATRGDFPIPTKTERVIVAALGTLANVGGSLDGWYAGQSLPLLGWDMAMGAGVVVTFANNKTPAHRDRHDGGWANTRELAKASKVVTRFDAPVRAVAIAVDDDPAAGHVDAASKVTMRLVGATRAIGPNGEPVPPRVLVQGVRTILLFEIEPEPLPDVLDPNLLVVVDGARDGHLAGVAGALGTVEELSTTIVDAGFDAAIRAALPGGPGVRNVSWRSAPRPKVKRASSASRRRS